nr:extensin-like [Penaeus vannamei]
MQLGFPHPPARLPTPGPRSLSASPHIQQYLPPTATIAVGVCPSHRPPSTPATCRVWLPLTPVQPSRTPAHASLFPSTPPVLPPPPPVWLTPHAHPRFTPPPRAEVTGGKAQDRSSRFKPRPAFHLPQEPTQCHGFPRQPARTFHTACPTRNGSGCLETSSPPPGLPRARRRPMFQSCFPLSQPVAGLHPRAMHLASPQRRAFLVAFSTPAMAFGLSPGTPPVHFHAPLFTQSGFPSPHPPFTPRAHGSLASPHPPPSTPTTQSGFSPAYAASLPAAQSRSGFRLDPTPRIERPCGRQSGFPFHPLPTAMPFTHAPCRIGFPLEHRGGGRILTAGGTMPVWELPLHRRAIQLQDLASPSPDADRLHPPAHCPVWSSPLHPPSHRRRAFPPPPTQPSLPRTLQHTYLRSASCKYVASLTTACFTHPAHAVLASTHTRHHTLHPAHAVVASPQPATACPPPAPCSPASRSPAPPPSHPAPPLQLGLHPHQQIAHTDLCSLGLPPLTTGRRLPPTAHAVGFPYSPRARAGTFPPRRRPPMQSLASLPTPPGTYAVLGVCPSPRGPPLIDGFHPRNPRRSGFPLTPTVRLVPTPPRTMQSASPRPAHAVLASRLPPPPMQSGFPSPANACCSCIVDMFRIMKADGDPYLLSH